MEPLKNQFGPDVVRRIAESVARVHPAFPTAAFLTDALDGYEALELMPRGWKIARALRRALPEDYPTAAEILIASLGPTLDSTEGQGMAPFFYMPHAFLVSEFGLGHFDVSMRAQYEITQRFTAEFSIRAYLDRHPEKTLAVLKKWTSDPSVHVRRLVSEGSRPRLPWAPRLKAFQKNPRPVLDLLERLKDDPELYVRRSVANNLNDIGKDHPALLVGVAKAWMKGASEQRKWIVRHALRSAVKRGDVEALKVLGFGAEAAVKLSGAHIRPPRAKIGSTVTIAFDLRNERSAPQRVMVDFAVHFVKAGGRTGRKVFKLKAATFAPGETLRFQKTVSLAKMTTRKHYAGRHQVDLLLNGECRPLGAFHIS